MSTKEVIKAKKIILMLLIVVFMGAVYINKNKLNITTSKDKYGLEFTEEINMDRDIVDVSIIDDKFFLNTEEKLYCYNNNWDEVWSLEIEKGFGVIYNNNYILLSNEKDNIKKLNVKGDMEWRYNESFSDIYLLENYTGILKEELNKNILEILDYRGNLKSEIEGFKGDLISLNTDSRKRVILNTLKIEDTGINSKLIYHSIYGDKLMELELNDIIIQKVYVDKDKNILVGDNNVIIVKGDKVELIKELKGEIISYVMDWERNSLFLIKKDSAKSIIRLDLDSGEILEKKLDTKYDKILLNDSRIIVYSENNIQFFDKDLNSKIDINTKTKINKILTHDNRIFTINEDRVSLTKEE